MANDTRGTSAGTGGVPIGGTDPGALARAAEAAASGADVHDRHPHQLYCRCGHPLHPDHIEMHRGMKLERYSCPQRRWWNTFRHPHAWMEPREGVPS